jgi:glycerol-1-phosphatase
VPRSRAAVLGTVRGRRLPLATVRRMADGFVVALDLDGVLWLGDHPLPGAADAVTRLRVAGLGVLFVSNNAATTRAGYVDKLDRMGVDASPDEVISSSMAAAELLASALGAGASVLVVGEAGLREAVGERDLTIVDQGPCAAVVVGLDRAFDYAKLDRAAAAIRAGARFVATNLDATYPTPQGLAPGNGAIVAAIVAAAGVQPEVAGKPHEPIAALVRARAPRGVVVGDRPSTDGDLARTLGWPFALVLSEVITQPGGEQVPDPPPALVGAALAELVDGIVALARS